MAAGCELSRRWQLPVLTLGPVADVGSEVLRPLGCEVGILRRHVAQIRGDPRVRPKVLLHVERSTSISSRRPINWVSTRRAAQQANGVQFDCFCGLLMATDM